MNSSKREHKQLPTTTAKAIATGSRVTGNGTTRFHHHRRRHRHKVERSAVRDARGDRNEKRLVDPKLARRRAIEAGANPIIISLALVTSLTLLLLAVPAIVTNTQAIKSQINDRDQSLPSGSHWSSLAVGSDGLSRATSIAAGGIKTASSSSSSPETKSVKPIKRARETRSSRSSSSNPLRSVKLAPDVSSWASLNNANGFNSNKRNSLELINDGQADTSSSVSNVASQFIPTRQTRQTNSSQKKCALILQRTYVRKLTNDIDNESDIEPTGRAERVCITYEHINEAIEEAKRRRNFRLSDELMEAIQSIEPTPPFISQLGELNLETVKVLKERFDLSPDEISEGLPLVDMSRTNFWPLCPLMVKPIKCDPTGRFRSFTGHCNNLDNPTWGASQTPFVRYLPPRHPDGIEEFRRSVVDEMPLPPARLVSSSVHRDADEPSGDLSLFIMVFGQVVDHELTQAAPPRDENGLDFNCCKEPTKSEYCSPIRIPENDPLYRKFGQTCMDFKRSLVGLRPNCRLGPRVHINTITPTIDGNTIYGSTKAVADQLRTFTGGQLKVQNVFKSMKMKPLLPKQTIRPDLDCFERPDNMFCFLAGDDRVNEQPTLTVMHTILVREHNRMASQLAKINPHWNDDRIFHETRHLMAAKISTIVQTEYLPMLIGNQMMEMNNLTSFSQSDYDPDIMPGISQGFTTAAFRQGHTFIQGQLRLHDSRTFKFIESISLRHLFKRPFHYYNPGQIDKVLAGALNTPAQSYDPFITQEIAGHLFQEPGEDFGMDLISINLQRGREQGVPGYVAFRERFTRLPKVRTFDDLLTTMSNRTVNYYSRLYKSVHDIDLWSGGVSEIPRDGAVVGPTFAAMIGYQFSQIKNGDRFWFENMNQPSSFTEQQLREIKKFSLARLLCINSDGVQLIQRKALRLPHQIYNPLMSCKDLNDIDLRYWREDPSTPGQFIE